MKRISLNPKPKLAPTKIKKKEKYVASDFIKQYILDRDAVLRSEGLIP